jgi:starch synthase
MHVLLVSSEVVPFAKTGGLADVAGALPRALASLGIEVTVALPRYRQIDGARFGLRKVHDGIRIPVGERQELLTVFEAPVPGGRALLLEHEGFFGRTTRTTPSASPPSPAASRRWSAPSASHRTSCTATTGRPA